MGIREYYLAQCDQCGAISGDSHPTVGRPAQAAQAAGWASRPDPPDRYGRQLLCPDCTNPTTTTAPTDQRSPVTDTPDQAADAAARTDEAMQRVQAIIDEFDSEGCAEIRDDDAPALRTVLADLADAQERAAELEELGTERYADKLVEEMRLRSLEIRNGRFEMDIIEAGELATAYVAMARTILGDAENYSETPFEFHVKIAEEPQKYILTVRRTGVGKLTPHQARQRAEAERDQARAIARTLVRHIGAIPARAVAKRDLDVDQLPDWLTAAEPPDKSD